MSVPQNGLVCSTPAWLVLRLRVFSLRTPLLCVDSRPHRPCGSDDTAAAPHPRSVRLSLGLSTASFLFILSESWCIQQGFVPSRFVRFPVSLRSSSNAGGRFMHLRRSHRSNSRLPLLISCSYKLKLRSPRINVASRRFPSSFRFHPSNQLP